MSTFNFDEVFQTIEGNVASLAKSSLHDYVTEAKTDGQNIVNGMKEELQQWTVELEEGALTMDDLNFLLKEEAAVAEMVSLKEAGLAAVRIDEFKVGITNVITGAVAGLIKV